ncbi:hypothetical protein [Comamonas avium]|uniref:hypothetical protein n=1 Tax=Comamonas avium TaxID=2762231 RepID=UPI00178398C7|nr:hypothetical protein [Comamonas avium]
MIAKKPYGRRLRDFYPLRPGEKKLLDACKKGEPAILDYYGVPRLAKDNRVVRADFLRFLLLGGDEHVIIHEKGLCLIGAYIFGKLDLSGCQINFNVLLEKCRFHKEISALDTKFNGPLSLQGSHLENGLIADRLQCVSSVFLKHVKSSGQILLRGAHIGGSLYFDGANLDSNQSKVLGADQINVAGNVILGGGFKSKGSVRLIGANIGGNFSCSGGYFESNGEEALLIDRVNVVGSVNLGKGFTAKGEVRLVSAKIGSNLSCIDGYFECIEGDALSADRLNINGDVILRDGFIAKGAVRLNGATVNGGLDCTNGVFEAKKDFALNASGLNVNQSVKLKKSSFSKGGVSFEGAQIGGDLDFSGGKFEAPKDQVLQISGAKIGGDVLLRANFLAKGEVLLVGAKIGGDIDCSNGHFEFPDGDALSIDRAEINGGVFFTDEFSAKGGVRLLGTRINGDLDCFGGKFESLSDYSLYLDSAVVCGAWQLKKLPVKAVIKASHFEVSVLEDDPDMWADGSALDGLRYAALGITASKKGSERAKWLKRLSDNQVNSAEFRPQPWRQIQRVLREIGHIEDAQLVGIAYERKRRDVGQVGESAPETNWFFAKWRLLVNSSLHWWFGLLAGYGYRPTRLITWMFAVWLVCGGAYWHLSLAPYRAIAPSAPLIFQDASYINCQPDQPGPPQPPANWYLCDELRSEYATFSPLAYSLDLMLPVVDLGQEKAWGAFIPAANAVWWKELFTHWAPGHVVRLITWFQILFGWVSSLLLVAIISGFSRRNDES